MIWSEVDGAHALSSFSFRLKDDDVCWVRRVQVTDRAFSGFYFGYLVPVCEHWCAAELSEDKELGHLWDLFVPDGGVGLDCAEMHDMIVFECAVTYGILPVGRG